MNKILIIRNSQNIYKSEVDYILLTKKENEPFHD